MTSRAEQLRKYARLRALRLIEEKPNITQRQIAGDLGISLGATHYMLRALVERGMVTVTRFSASSNKQAFVYTLTPAGITEKSVIAAQFLKRKREEYEALRQEIESLGAEIVVANDRSKSTARGEVSDE